MGQSQKLAQLGQHWGRWVVAQRGQGRLKSAGVAGKRIPDVLPASGIAALLGISRQRVHQLVDRGTLPPPDGAFPGLYYWHRADIETAARDAGYVLDFAAVRAWLAECELSEVDKARKRDVKARKARKLRRR